MQRELDAHRHSTGKPMSVKWKTMKVVFRYGERTNGPMIKPQWPLVFDLIDDPVEEWDLIEKRLDCAWVFAPVAALVASLQQSAARYPHIKPGQEFAGYSEGTPTMPEVRNDASAGAQNPTEAVL